MITDQLKSFPVFQKSFNHNKCDHVRTYQVYIAQVMLQLHSNRCLIPEKAKKTYIVFLSKNNFLSGTVLISHSIRVVTVTFPGFFKDFFSVFQGLSVEKYFSVLKQTNEKKMSKSYMLKCKML